MLNNLIDGFDGRALLDFIRPNDAKFRAQRQKSKKDGLQRWEAQFLYGRLKTGMKLEHPSDLGSQDFVVAIKVVVAFPINVCGESMLWLCRLCGRDEQEPNKSGRKVYAKQKWLKSNCGT